MAFQLNIFLILTGLTEVYSIATVNRVSVKAGDSILIPCLYDQKYINHVKYLCKGYSYNFCSTVVRTNQQSSGKFLISDDKKQKIFTVTINNVTDGDAHFWCVVEINGGQDVAKYFRLSVTKGVSSLYVDHQKVTGFIGKQVTLTCYCQNSGEATWCRVGRPCVWGTEGSIDGTPVILDRSNSSVLTVTMRELKMGDSGWYWCTKGDFQMPVYIGVDERPTIASGPVATARTTDEDTPNSLSDSFPISLVISLSLLIFIVIVSLFIWFCIKRKKHIQEKSSAEMLAENEVTRSKVMKKKVSPEQPFGTQDEVTYTSVRKPQERRPMPLCFENEVSYSSVKIPQRVKTCETTDIYSNVTSSRKL